MFRLFTESSTCLVDCWANIRSISSSDDSLAYRLMNSLAYVCIWSENNSETKIMTPHLILSYKSPMFSALIITATVHGPCDLYIHAHRLHHPVSCSVTLALESPGNIFIVVLAFLFHRLFLFQYYKCPYGNCSLTCGPLQGLRLLPRWPAAV